jgi:hypothetical protein
MVREPWVTLTHSWCRVDLSRIAFAQSWLCALGAVSPHAVQTTMGANSIRGSRFFMREVYYDCRDKGTNRKGDQTEAPEPNIYEC